MKLYGMELEYMKRHTPLPRPTNMLVWDNTTDTEPQVRKIDYINDMGLAIDEDNSVWWFCAFIPMSHLNESPLIKKLVKKSLFVEERLEMQKSGVFDTPSQTLKNNSL